MRTDYTLLNYLLQIYDLTALKKKANLLPITKSKLHRPFSNQSKNVI